MAKGGKVLSRTEIVRLLQARGPEQQKLFSRATSIRRERFGERAIIRGVIEVTNKCRVNCRYCPMRLENTRDNDTYLMNEGEILDTVSQLKECGIRVVFLQGGEIPQTTTLVGQAIPKIRELVPYPVEILLCLGNKSKREYSYLRGMGADSYILKQETSDPELHEQIREASWPERKRCLIDLLSLGYRVGTGVIVGLPGQTLEHLADDILFAKTLGVSMMSAAPLVPAGNTPFANLPAGDFDTALNFMAVSRLVEPEWLIPTVSAMEKIRPGGQLAGLNAGANVMTANFTIGTKRDRYLIYGKERFVVEQGHVWDALRQAGLRPDLSDLDAPLGLGKRDIGRVGTPAF